MARTRRRMAKPPRRRQRADWVYRPRLYDDAGNAFDDLGTYDPVTKSLVAGISTPQAGVLYDSHNYMTQAVATTAASNVRLARAARAEGRNPKVMRVQGMMTVRPSVWAIGSQIQLGIRFGIFEQSPDVGSLILDPEYTMWLQTIEGKDSPATMANDRKWQHERRFIRLFDTNATQFTLPFNFRVNRSLLPHECYAVYFEGSSSSVNLVLQCWFRTLVQDEG